jgi:hypothetical protein
MANRRLIHDVAFALSVDILEVVAGCVREEEQRDAFVAIYERVKAGIECFDMQSMRIMSRLRPGKN